MTPQPQASSLLDRLRPFVAGESLTPSESEALFRHAEAQDRVIRHLARILEESRRPQHRIAQALIRHLREIAVLPSSPAPQEAPPESDAARAARYERAIRAISKSTLMGADFSDWVQCVCEDVLEGYEAKCPFCETDVHDGPCVDEEAAGAAADAAGE